VSVDLVVEGAADLGAFEVDLLFDPQLVTVTQVLPGGFLASTGNTALPLGPAAFAKRAAPIRTRPRRCGLAAPIPTLTCFFNRPTRSICRSSCTSAPAGMAVLLGAGSAVLVRAVCLPGY
jgi:hypothetical protein